MWEPRRLTTLWAFTACCRDSFTFNGYDYLLVCIVCGMHQVVKMLSDGSNTIDHRQLGAGHVLYEYIHILCTSSYIVLIPQPFLLFLYHITIVTWSIWPVYEQIWFYYCACFLAVYVAVCINFPMRISCDEYWDLARLSVDVTFQIVQIDYDHSLIQFLQASYTP
jgi:hypothetical protein